MYGYIYLIEDINTGMKYIGQHKNKNMLLDKNYHGSGRIIKDIRKKRPETLVESIICSGDSIEELNFFEEYWIEKLNTLYPNGYNCTTGGYYYCFTDEVINKMSESLKKRWTISEQREKLIESAKLKVGEKNPFFGKHHTEETKQKISEKNKGKKPTKPFKKGRTPWNKGVPMSEEQKIKLSEIKKGRTPWNKGVHMSEEQKKKISETKRKNKNLT